MTRPPKKQPKPTTTGTHTGKEGGHSSIGGCDGDPVKLLEVGAWVMEVVVGISGRL